jgi:hypothetical protein
MTEAAASAQVLGMSFEQLGLGVAREWGLPESLQRGMRRPVGEPPSRRLDNEAERRRWLARTANDAADLILHTPPEQAHSKLQQFIQRHGRALGVTNEDFAAAADTARQRLAQMSDALQIVVPRDSDAHRLFAPVQAPPPEDFLTAHQLQPTEVLEPTLPLSDQQSHREQAVEMLAAGIQDITDAMVENFQLHAVLRMILETIYRALGLRRIIFCLRDAKGQVLTGRLGLGVEVERLAPRMRIELGSHASDLFAAVCVKGADTLIRDAASIGPKLPAWYSGELRGNSFVLLPLVLKGVPIGLIYADKAEANGIDLGEKELALLRTLRNQAVMAFRQAGS